MPSIHFPVSILQNGLKLTTEPPRGIKANLKRSYNDMTDEAFKHSRSEWNVLIFGLSFFHAVVQERRKFGPLGWNIRYQFNDSDLEASATMLRNFLNESETIPWDSMKFITGDINYGGRVTDDLDRLLLLCILRQYYTPEILEEGYRFSRSGQYYAPNLSTVNDYRRFIDTLPSEDAPEVFGMHENASLTLKINESASIISTILEIQPRSTTSSEGKSSDQQVLDLIAEMEQNHPQLIDQKDCSKSLFKLNNQGLMHCLSTVLIQEIERFNCLIAVMKASLVSLSRAIQGLESMSNELDNMYVSFLKMKIPSNWESVSYSSLRNLSSWFADLNKRVSFVRKWCQEGHPNTFWPSGFFNFSGFMTGVLQAHARKHRIPIDLLKFSFKFAKTKDPEKIQAAPEDGVFVSGLYLESARWNLQDSILEDQEVLQAPAELEM